VNTTPLPYDATELEAVSGTYQLLGRLWAREVDVSLYEMLDSTETRELFVAAGGKLPKANDLTSAAEVETFLEQLAIEYCELFIGPKKHLPPFQSVWQTGQFQSPAIESMRDFIDVTNFSINENASTLMSDHLAVQLSVMAHLCELMTTDQRPELLEIAQHFFARHLTWHAGLVDGVVQRNVSDFYSSVAKITGDFLEQEQAIWLTPIREAVQESDRPADEDSAN
jgi:TorA maturation chaperone TorD